MGQTESLLFSQSIIFIIQLRTAPAALVLRGALGGGDILGLLGETEVLAIDPLGRNTTGYLSTLGVLDSRLEVTPRVWHQRQHPKKKASWNLKFWLLDSLLFLSMRSWAGPLFLRSSGSPWTRLLITCGFLGFLGGSEVKNLPVMQEIWVQYLGWEDPLVKGMATDSSRLAGRIP